MTKRINIPIQIKIQCSSLVNLANMLQIFSISTYMSVMDIHKKITTNKASIIDLQKVISLCDILEVHPMIDDETRINIGKFKEGMNLFILSSAQPSYPCGLWNNCVIGFDEDQYL